MLVCPNCDHYNPDGATQCEACYTPLPATTSCPNCSTSVQTDATFCGQCGFNLRSTTVTATGPTIGTDFSSKMPELVSLKQIVQPEPVVLKSSSPDLTPVPAKAVSHPFVEPNSGGASVPPPPPTITTAPGTEQLSPPPPPQQSHPKVAATKTQLQQQTAQLLHVQTDALIELPQNLSVIHIGKQNDRIPADIDVSGFPNSEIVSRIHADIRVEADAYYIEDVGSSNGTYVNNKPLSTGDRHRLRAGDRISLGKGNLVTFLFQVSESVIN